MILSLVVTPGVSYADETDQELNLSEDNSQTIDYDELEEQGVEPKDMQDPEFQSRLDELLEGVDKEEYIEEYYGQWDDFYQNVMKLSDENNTIIQFNSIMQGVIDEDEDGNNYQETLMGRTFYDGYDITDLSSSTYAVLTTPYTQFSYVYYFQITIDKNMDLHIAFHQNNNTYDFYSSKYSDSPRKGFYSYGFVPFQGSGLFPCQNLNGTNEVNLSSNYEVDSSYYVLGTNLYSKTNLDPLDYWGLLNLTSFNTTLPSKAYLCSLYPTTNNDIFADWGYNMYNKTNTREVNNIYIQPTLYKYKNYHLNEYNLVDSNSYDAYNTPFPTTSLNSNGSWFADMPNLKHIYHINALNCTTNSNLNNMFQNCTSLTDTNNIEGLSSIISKCSGGSGMFKGCTSLTNATLSSTPNNAKYDNMFNGCSNLKTLNISGLNNTSYTSTANMFNGCIRLQQVTLSSNWRFTEDGVLPVIDSAYVENASGYWYDKTDDTAEYEMSPLELMSELDNDPNTYGITWYSNNVGYSSALAGKIIMNDNNDQIEIVIYNPEKDPDCESPIQKDKYHIIFNIANNKNMNNNNLAKDVLNQEGYYLTIDDIKDIISENTNKRNQYWLQPIIIGGKEDVELDIIQLEFDPSFTLSAPISYNAGWYDENGIEINKKPFYSYVNTSYTNEEDDLCEFTYYSQFKPSDMQVDYNGENISLLEILDDKGAIGNMNKRTFTNQAIQKINFSTTAEALADYLADYWFDEDGDLVEEIGSVQYYVDDMKPLKFIEA